MICKNLSPEESAKLKEPLTRTVTIEHEIPMIGRPNEDLTSQGNPRTKENHRRRVKEGMIIKISGPWCSTIILVRKKESTIRFCADYRKLNDVTHRDAYPLPRIDDILDALQGAK